MTDRSPLKHSTSSHPQNRRVKKRQKTSVGDDLEHAYGDLEPAPAETKRPAKGSAIRLVKSSLYQLSTFYEGKDQATKLHDYFQTQDFKDICDKVFESVDKDLNGTLDKNELHNAFTMVMQKIPTSAKVIKFGLNPKVSIKELGIKFVQQAWQFLDADGNGSLDRDEFVIAMMLLWTEATKIKAKALAPQQLVKNSLDQLYRKYDKDKIDALKLHFPTDQQCRGIFHDADKNGDKKLNPEECLAAFTDLCGKIPNMKKTLGPDFDHLTKNEGIFIIKASFKRLDSDSSGYLEFQEFCIAMKIFMMHAFHLLHKVRQKKQEEEGHLRYFDL